MWMFYGSEWLPWDLKKFTKKTLKNFYLFKDFFIKISLIDLDRDIIEDFKENYLKSFETNKTPVLRADPPVIVEELDDCT